MYSQQQIENLILKFKNTSLNKPEWNYETHIILAIWYNWHYTFEQALKIVRTNIKAYNESVGTPNTEISGYHETLTVFWMTLTKNFLAYNFHEKIDNVINEFLKTREADISTTSAYYSNEVLFSKKARREWINGNKKPINLDFNNLNV
tara:strand:+ start:3716 stop:4159 length:444 start_codon:yes stop_codon:yes gene_type:complete